MGKTIITIAGVIAIVALVYIGARYDLPIEYMATATSVISGVIGFALGRPSGKSL